VGGQTYVDESSGSHASSGDPFSIGWDNNFYYTGATAGRLPNAVTFTAVPEPEGYALALAGFTVLGLMARRRRQPA